jgi:quinol monooxygenase YgiN
MVIERLEFEVAAGQLEAFLKFIQETRGVIENSTGCHGLTFGHGVENPGKIILLVTWASLEAHAEAKKPDAYVHWSGRFKTFIGGRPAMEHFNVAS